MAATSQLLETGIQRFHGLVKSKFIRFILVGGLNTAFGYGVYCLMIFIGLPYVWATLVSQILGVLFNFFTTGALVFDNRDRRLLLRFVLNYILTYFISIGANKACQELFGWNTYISGIGAMIVSALCSFFILKFFVYGSRQEEKD